MDVVIIEMIVNALLKIRTGSSGIHLRAKYGTF